MRDELEQKENAELMSGEISTQNYTSESSSCQRNDPTKTPHTNQRLALLLAIIGCLTLLKVRWDSVLHDSRWIPVLESSIYALTAIGLFFRQRTGLAWSIRFCVTFLLVSLPVVSFVVLRMFGKGEATEILLMQICQNSSLASASLGRSRKMQQLSVLFSFFLVIFVTTLSETPAIFLFTIPYLVLGVWWLMTNHWSRLESYMPNKVTSNFRVRSYSFMATILLLASVAAIVGWNHKPIMKTISGIMPTSGGNRYSDRYARGGVGDGDFFVAATNHASTVGPVESDLFLESSKPSLFDIIEENYDRPMLPVKKKSERAFSPDDVQLKHAEEKLVQSEQSGRTFRILRGARDEKQSVTETRSNALFYLVGPVPIRLALRYYDQFDGLDWSVSKAAIDLPRAKFSGVQVGGKFWVKSGQQAMPMSRDKQGSSRQAHPFFQGYDNHSIKVMRLSTNRVLAPSSMSGWHFDKCDDTRFFKSASDGAIEFAGRDSLPELAVYHLVSHGVNYRSLSNSNAISLTSRKSPFATQKEFADWKKLAEIARRVTRDDRNDWQKVESIVRHLRAEYRLATTDDSATDTKVDVESPINRFLKDKQGPDFLFATVAAMMIRSLGMETRLVNGFYVGNQDYDSYSDQSIVHASNLHFWVEVRVNGRDWVTIEPSPGFSPPRTKITWGQRASAFFMTVFYWIVRHRWLLMGLVVAGTLAWVFRLRLMLLLFFLFWFLERAGASDRKVMATFRFIRRRLWAMNEKKSSFSISELCKTFQSSVAGQSSAVGDEDWRSFQRAVNQLHYQSVPDLREESDLDKACWAIALAGMKK